MRMIMLMSWVGGIEMMSGDLLMISGCSLICKVSMRRFCMNNDCGFVCIFEGYIGVWGLHRRLGLEGISG